MSVSASGSFQVRSRGLGIVLIGRVMGLRFVGWDLQGSGLAGPCGSVIRGGVIISVKYELGRYVVPVSLPCIAAISFMSLVSIGSVSGSRLICS